MANEPYTTGYTRASAEQYRRAIAKIVAAEYALDVTPSPETVTTAPPAAQARGSRRRGFPSPAEQARREAWGRQWGGMIAAFWKQQRERERR